MIKCFWIKISYMKNKVSLFKRIIVLLLVGQSSISCAQKTNQKVYIIEYEVLKTQKVHQVYAL